jgi:hypothetical protein
MGAQAKVGPDGFPEPLATPMLQLAEDVPLRPALLGNLQLQQLNLWMGNAPEGMPPFATSLLMPLSCMPSPPLLCV